MIFKNKLALIILLILIAIPTISICQDWSDPINFSRVETETFQNGVSPTNAYNGIEMTHINWTNPTTNYLDDPGDTVSTVGYGNRLILKFDIADLPDSAIIRHATFWFLLRDGGGFNDNDDYMLLGIYRLYSQFVDPGTATWQLSQTDESWLANGAADSVLSVSNLFGAAIQTQMKTNINSVRSTWTTRAKRYGFMLGIGPDSLNTIDDITNLADRDIMPDGLIQVQPVRVGDNALGGFWCRADITYIAQRLHRHYWHSNTAFLIMPVWIHQDGTGDYLRNDANNATHVINIPNSNASVKSAPFITVDYAWGTVSDGSSGGGSGASSFGGFGQGPR